MVQHSVAMMVRVLLVLGRPGAWQPSLLLVEDLTQDGGRVSGKMRGPLVGRGLLEKMSGSIVSQEQF